MRNDLSSPELCTKIEADTSPILKMRSGFFFSFSGIGSHPEQFSEEDFLLLTCGGKGESVRNTAEAARLIVVRKELQRRLTNPPELDGDLSRVKAHVSSYNFTPMLNDLLDKIADEFGKGDGFD